jgi:hypothetical protein
MTTALKAAGVQSRSHRLDLFTVYRGFVALRLHAGCSQYCFPQPRKPKHQQYNAYKNMQIVQRHTNERTAC